MSAVNLEALRNKKGFISDMDGVIYHGNMLLPGAGEFVKWLEDNGKDYIFLTNSPERTPVSYTHLDVYKRQQQDTAGQPRP